MKRTVLLVFVLSGLSALPTSVRVYHYVSTLKTWAEAQSHCREAFGDLAAVGNQEDSDRLLRALQGREGEAWIGLFDDLTRWKWTLGNADFNNATDFSNWNPNQPDNGKSSQNCTLMMVSGGWGDRQCSFPYPSVCYHEGGPPMYILVTKPMTWHQALKNCRAKYTDLVSLRSRTENEHVHAIVKKKSWVGLHRDTWAHWSDRSAVTFTNWNVSQPSSSHASCVKVNTTTGTWRDAHCEEKHHFICQTREEPQRKTRIKIKFQSEADLNDPAVKQQILEQLHAKLEKHGIPDFKLRWMETEGQTFSKEHQGKKDKGSCT